MSKNIGVAGKQFYYVDSQGCKKPRGRVCAFSKALHTVDFNRRYMIRLIKNAILWSNMDKGNKLFYFDTENDNFNSKIESLCSSIGFTVTKIEPWYAKDDSFDDHTTETNKASVYLLFPSYNPRGGSFMPDLVQHRLMEEVQVWSKGLVICEWFHYMQSIDSPNKRSFSFHGDGTLSSQAEADDTKGLFTLSPFDFDDFIDIEKPDDTIWSQGSSNDSMDYGLHNFFSYSNRAGSGYYTAGYNGIFSEIYRITDDSQVFRYIDPNEILTTTSTTTTTVAPVDDADIRFRVATIREGEATGPYLKTLEGQHANLFELRDNEIFLIKSPDRPATYNLKIKYSDFFKEKRFPDFYKPITLSVNDCGAPITLPYRIFQGETRDRRSTYGFYSDCKDLWDRPSGVYYPLDGSWSVSGEGTPESPFVAKLSATHCQNPALWMQINEPGQLTWSLKSSTESLSNTNNYCSGDITLTTQNSDFASLHVVSGEILPSSHNKVIKDYGKDAFPNPNTIYNAQWSVESIVEGVAGSGIVRSGTDTKLLNFNKNSGSFNVYVVLGFSKDDKISYLDDEVEATLIIGTTPAPVPEDATFDIIIINRVAGTVLSGATDNRSERSITEQEGITVTGKPEQNISISITDSTMELVDPLQYTFIPANALSITTGSSSLSATINDFIMPAGGGSCIIYIDGQLTPKPTTTQPPRATNKIIFKNMAYETTFNFKDLIILPYDPTLNNLYEYTYNGAVGTGSTKDQGDCTGNNFMTYSPNSDDFEYRSSHVPILSATDDQFDAPAGSTNEYISCEQTDIGTEIISTLLYYHCDNNTETFDMGEDGISVKYGKSACSGSSSSNPLPIKIGLPDIVEGGLTIYVRLDGSPVAKPPPTTQPPVTTQAPTTTEEPCDDLILVLCEQTLVCELSGSECVPNLSQSSNTIKFDTCCNHLSEADIIRRVYTVILEQEAGSTDTVLLKQAIDSHYAANGCPSTPTEAFVDCSEISGSCSTVTAIRTLAAVSCYGASSNPPNPLP